MRQMMAIVAFAALGGVALTSPAASAMPNGMTPTAKQAVGQSSDVQQVRWVRDVRGRRVWRAGPRRFVAVGPRRVVAVGPRRVWGPGWRGAYAWSPAPPVWGPSPGWGSSWGPGWGPGVGVTVGWGARPGWGPGWGPRPGWGWNSGWW
jgi:hypothetical protein